MDRPQLNLVESEPDAEVFVWLDQNFLFKMMVLYACFLAFFAAFCYLVSDHLFAVVACIDAIAVLIGLSLQVLLGVPPWLRFYYSLCGLVVFLYLVMAGGSDGARLLAILALVPGFVAMLGYRHGTLLLSTLIVAVGIIFYFDLYALGSPGYDYLTEVRFLTSCLGLSLYYLYWDYSRCRFQGELIAENRKVHAMAYRDSMTSLANRRAMEELLLKRWDEFQRGGQAFSVLLCDVDNLKSFNDRFGHEFGDVILNRIANLLNRGLRAQDTVARWGGDEFLVMLPGQGHTTALKVAERLRKRVQAIELSMKNESLYVTISIGVTSIDHAVDINDLVNVADGALYQAKQMGRNQVVLG